MKTRKVKNPFRIPTSIGGNCYTMGGNCYTTDGNRGTIHGSGYCGTIGGFAYRGIDHGPDLDAIGNVGSSFAGTDVGRHGIADDGIHYVGDLGANSYGNCHANHDVNDDFAHSHWMNRKMPWQQQ